MAGLERGMKPDLNSLFFVALWAWMRAHPTCHFDDFNQAISRIIDQMGPMIAERAAQETAS